MEHKIGAHVFNFVYEEDRWSATAVHDFYEYENNEVKFIGLPAQSLDRISSMMNYPSEFVVKKDVMTITWHIDILGDIEVHLFRKPANLESIARRIRKCELSIAEPKYHNLILHLDETGDLHIKISSGELRRVLEKHLTKTMPEFYIAEPPNTRQNCPRTAIALSGKYKKYKSVEDLIKLWIPKGTLRYLFECFEKNDSPNISGEEEYKKNIPMEFDYTLLFPYGGKTEVVHFDIYKKYLYPQEDLKKYIFRRDFYRIKCYTGNSSKRYMAFVDKAGKHICFD
jgi:hypothetical protein